MQECITDVQRVYYGHFGTKMFSIHQLPPSWLTCGKWQRVYNVLLSMSVALLCTVSGHNRRKMTIVTAMYFQSGQRATDNGRSLLPSVARIRWAGERSQWGIMPIVAHPTMWFRFEHCSLHNDSFLSGFGRCGAQQWPKKIIIHCLF